MFLIREESKIRQYLEGNKKTMERSTDPKERSEILETVKLVEAFLNGQYTIPFAVDVESVCTCDPTGLREDEACEHCRKTADKTADKEGMPF